MKKGLITLLLVFIILSSRIFAQDETGSEEAGSMVNIYMRNFVRASLGTKVQILQDAAKIEDEEMGPLYLRAVEFVLNNAELIATDQTATELAVLAIRLIGESEYTPAKYKVWKLFNTSKDTTLRIAIMNALGIIARNDNDLIDSLNTWLSRANSLLAAGEKPDPQVVKECVVTLGKLGDVSSFPILFTIMNLGYSKEIQDKAEEVLFEIGGDLKENFIGVINNNPIPEKIKALKMALASERLNDNEKGEIAERALILGLRTTTNSTEERAVLREMRFESINALNQRRWARATESVIEHFNTTVQEFERGVSGLERLIEAIECLGAMGTHEAAERLNVYLGLMNSLKESGNAVNERIVLRVIQNLGELGDRVAADNLLYISYLDYGDAVKEAAREAFNNLKR
ncbi:MAG: hypothetical protein DRP87_00995 [Spirochaetes bacterium]|nr:MAG: hypothetical protein DRP87_00995 [Spirochaetota bacterium]